jgi:REP element-mobilizing transposase RayT
MHRKARVIVPGMPHHIVQREYNRKAVVVGLKSSGLGKLILESPRQ